LKINCKNDLSLPQDQNSKQLTFRAVKLNRCGLEELEKALREDYTHMSFNAANADEMAKSLAERTYKDLEPVIEKFKEDPNILKLYILKPGKILNGFHYIAARITTPENKPITQVKQALIDSGTFVSNLMKLYYRYIK
jgi:hypothetical protein